MYNYVYDHPDRDNEVLMAGHDQLDYKLLVVSGMEDTGPVVIQIERPMTLQTNSITMLQGPAR
jgi:hypothetical protein